MMNDERKIRNSKFETNSKYKGSKFQTKAGPYRGNGFCFGHLFFGHLILFRISCFEFRIYFVQFVIIRVIRGPVFILIPYILQALH